MPQNVRCLFYLRWVSQNQWTLCIEMRIIHTTRQTKRSRFRPRWSCSKHLMKLSQRKMEIVWQNNKSWRVVTLSTYQFGRRELERMNE